MILLFLLGLLLFSRTLAEEEYFTVRTRFGPVRGMKLHSRGRSGFVFTGIPISKPPLGNLRFRSLVDPEPWSETLDVFNYRNACISNPQKTYAAQNGGPVSEDCMYTNVFSSEKCLTKGDCAVMVVVHGGARNFESPVIYDRDIIVHNFANKERNVVVVSIPYRMGILGWMHLAPGMKTSTDTNLAMRDILFNLEWVQREIRNFGGNPLRVTLMGHSAGSTMALEIALSPLSEGLFSQLLHMSGFSTGGERTKEVNYKYSRKAAHILNCAEEIESYSNVTRVEEIIGCLRRKTDQEILHAQFVMHNYVEENHGTWIDGPKGVMPIKMYDLLRKPKAINVLLGTVTAEQRDTRLLSGKPHEIDQLCAFLAYGRNYERPEGFRRSCNKRYGKENMTQFMNDDLNFYYHTGYLANSFSRKGNVYVYSFQFEGGRSAFARAQKDYLGPSHAEDFMLVFGLHRIWENFDALDSAMEESFTGMMCTFVNKGHPNIFDQKWDKWENKRRNYFLIDLKEGNSTMPGMREEYYRDAHDFWEKTAKRTGGNWRPLHSFPEEADIYLGNALAISLVAKISNNSVIYDKNVQALELTFDTWTKHLQRLMWTQKDVVVDDIDGQSNNVLFLTVLLGSTFILFGGAFWLTVRFCRPKEYQNLDQ